MKEIKIKLYGISDFKKWFWDRFCFPKRKLVTKWLEFHNSAVRSIVETYLIKCGNLCADSEDDMKALSMFLREYDKEVNKVTECTEELIMMK